MVGVDGEDEAQPLQTFLAVGAQYEAPVERLPRRRDSPRARRTRSVIVNVPSRTCRVASLACFMQRASVYGPAGRTTRSRVNSVAAGGLGGHTEIVRAAEDRLRFIATALLLQDDGPVE